jgi:processive 1,2-diacylglycerol beta-glucosyltransferase
MKKIVIFNSLGGGGHIAVTNALKQYLERDYDVVVSDVFATVLAPIDVIHKISSGKLYGEAIYNFFIRKKWYTPVNILFIRFCVAYLKTFRKKAKNLLEQYIDEQKPDIIISVVPFINDFILEIAQEKNLYFLLIPTDFDIATFLYHIKQPHYEKFMMAIPFEDKKIFSDLETAKISHNNYRITGFVVRPDFFETKNLQLIRSRYDVTENKPVILLMFGAVGSRELSLFVKKLRHVTQPLHMIICIGKQEYMRDKINSLIFPEHISKTVVGFTQDIADLMAISDLIITKSGTVTVAEALYMNLPLILDGTSEVLKWERYNHAFIEQQGFGVSLKQRSELPLLVDRLLKNRLELATYKQNLMNFNKKNGGLEIKSYIDTIIVP